MPEHINQYGEIVRSQTAPARPSPPAPALPAVTPRRARRNSDVPGAILSAILVSIVLMGIGGAIIGFGAGKRWCKTNVPEAGKWHKTVLTFTRGVYLDSWTSQPIHHAMQDATIPLRVVLMIAAAIAILVGVFSEDDTTSSDNEAGGKLVMAAVLIVLATALVGVVVRLLIYLLTMPVTWFVRDITTPVGGALVVGLCWAVMGALLGGLIGAAIAEEQRR